MRTLGIIALCVVLLIGGAVALYKLAYPTYTYRYRMTVEVAVDGAVHSSSSVIEVNIQKQPNLLANVTIFPYVVGEAVFVDLGKGRNVIAILASDAKGGDVNYPYEIVPRLFQITYADSDLPNLANLRGRRDILGQYLPAFVTFSDLSDPKTARVVGPDQFEQVFGPDVHFKGAWIEMTDEPVTRGIEKKLHWLPHPGYLSGKLDVHQRNHIVFMVGIFLELASCSPDERSEIRDFTPIQFVVDLSRSH